MPEKVKDVHRRKQVLRTSNPFPAGYLQGSVGSDESHRYVRCKPSGFLVRSRWAALSTSQRGGYDRMLRSGPVSGPLVMTGLCFFFLSWGHEKQEVLAMIRTCATGAASRNMPNILTGPSAYCRQWRILSARSGQRTTVCRIRHRLVPAGVHWKRVRHFRSGVGGSCMEGRSEGSLGLYKIMV